MRPMALILHRPTDVDAFMAQASEFLAAREAEHNLFFGITSQIRSAPELFAVDRPTFAVVVDRGGNVVAANSRSIRNEKRYSVPNLFFPWLSLDSFPSTNLRRRRLIVPGVNSTSSGVQPRSASSP